MDGKKLSTENGKDGKNKSGDWKLGTGGFVGESNGLNSLGQNVDGKKWGEE